MKQPPILQKAATRLGSSERGASPVQYLVLATLIAAISVVTLLLVWDRVARSESLALLLI